MSQTDLHDDDIDEQDDELTRETADDSELVRNLRRQLKTANKRAKTADELEQENRALKGERLLDQAGLKDLTERQRKALLREVDELTPDALHAAAVDLGWAQPEDDPAEREIAEQKAIVDATRGAAPKGATQITPAEAAAWSPDRRLEFRKQHPAEFKALQSGQTVTGISF